MVLLTNMISEFLFKFYLGHCSVWTSKVKLVSNKVFGNFFFLNLKMSSLLKHISSDTVFLKWLIKIVIHVFQYLSGFWKTPWAETTLTDRWLSGRWTKWNAFPFTCDFQLFRLSGSVTWDLRVGPEGPVEVPLDRIRS